MFRGGDWSGALIEGRDKSCIVEVIVGAVIGGRPVLLQVVDHVITEDIGGRLARR
jgi:hypothetical protein